MRKKILIDNAEVIHPGGILQETADRDFLTGRDGWRYR
jgi:hypothetical protein